jgi:trk system potassium uptake protein TrkH
LLRILPVLRVLGGLLIGLAGMMAGPLAYDLFNREPSASWFIAAMAASAVVGAALLILSASNEPFELTRRQAFLTTGVAWLMLPAFAAVPFLGIGLDFVRAYFEAASGLTTTGSTVLVGLDSAPRGILLWRSMLQMIGALGIVVLGIIVMPFLRVAGMQLFKTESSDSSEKVFAKGLDLARWIAAIYVGLIGICAAVYAALGMSAFDAVNHAMTTIATGGFSTHDASFAYFDSAAIDWTAVAFMTAGGLPFIALIRTIRRSRAALVRDIQAQGYCYFLLAASLLLAITRTTTSEADFGEALRQAAFSVVSIVTTSGYATTDYQTWGAYAVGAFFILTFVGGCSGSTAGGIKIYRIQILWMLATAHLTRLVTPSQAVVVSYSTRRVTDEIEIAILTFLVAMLVSTAVITTILAFMGLDLVTAVSGAATALANVGPGLGPIIGPAGNFSSLPDGALAVLSLAMILGRLEFFTLLVMLTPAFWRG